MAAHNIDHASLWADGKYFAQTSVRVGLPTPPPENLSIEEKVIAVAKELLGDSYRLNIENVSSPADAEGSQVYAILTKVLPVLSEQSKFFWERAAKTLGSMLQTANYPVHSQVSNLIFWWARLGGLNGHIEKGTTKETLSEMTRDGSCCEFSWVIPQETDPKAPCNRRVRFGVDPFHPDFKTRLAGGATTDYLWSDLGGMGLVTQEGGKVWKDTIEKWLFPNLESTEQVVPGCTYFICFDLDPSGLITIKHYYMPPPPNPNVEPQFHCQGCRLTTDLTRFKLLFTSLHPSMVKPLDMVIDYLDNEGKDSGMMFAMTAWDSTTLEKNRIKLYLWTPKHTLNEIIRNMTLAGKLNGPVYDKAIADFRKLFKHLFPYATNDDTELRPQHMIDDVPEAYAEGDPGRHDAGLLYYYEFSANAPLPNPKVYFLMDFFGKNDLSTTQGVEAFLRDVGKPGEQGWFTDDIARAVPLRDLGARTGTQTAFTFGIKPKGWDVMGYYSPEVYRATEEAEARKKKAGSAT